MAVTEVGIDREWTQELEDSLNQGPMLDDNGQRNMNEEESNAV